MENARTKNADQPLVTMALLTYNSARSVVQSLAALQAQDYPNLEILVIDDASKDDTVEVCRRQAGNDARVRIEQNPKNLGQWGNYSLAAERSRGEFMCWACPGDSWDPHYVSTLVKRLQEVPGAIAVQSAVERIDEYTRAHVKTHSMGGPHAPDILNAWQRARDSLRKVGEDVLRPRYSYFQHGLVSTNALRKTFGAFPKPLLILNERTVVCHWALAGPLVTVKEPLIQRELHEQPAHVRWQNDPWLRARTSSRFYVSKVIWQIASSIVVTDLLPWQHKLLMPAIVANYWTRTMLHTGKIAAVLLLRRTVPSPAYSVLRRWYRVIRS